MATTRHQRRKTIFQLQASEHIYSSTHEVNPRSIVRRTKTPVIYNIHNYTELLAISRATRLAYEQNNPKATHQPYVTVRIVITLNHEIRFGKIGKPNPCNDIPAHNYLSARCVFAGDQDFNANNEIVRITPQSGGFLTFLTSTQIALVEQHQQGLKFGERVNIQEALASGPATSHYYSHDRLLYKINQVAALKAAQRLLAPQISSSPHFENALSTSSTLISPDRKKIESKPVTPIKFSLTSESDGEVEASPPRKRNTPPAFERSPTTVSPARTPLQPISPSVSVSNKSVVSPPKHKRRLNAGNPLSSINISTSQSSSIITSAPVMLNSTSFIARSLHFTAINLSASKVAHLSASTTPLMLKPSQQNTTPLPTYNAADILSSQPIGEWYSADDAEDATYDTDSETEDSPRTSIHFR
jgi:hypothetical protein